MAKDDKEHPKRTLPKGMMPPWQPGQSGNPAGRPKGLKDGIRGHLNRLMDKRAPAEILKALMDKSLDLDDGTYADAITHMLSIAALTGKPADRLAAIRVILEQTEDPRVKRIAPVEMDGEVPYSTTNDAELVKIIGHLSNGKKPTPKPKRKAKPKGKAKGKKGGIK